MKVLIVTGIFPPDIGGPATYLPKLAKYLVQQGHQVSVITMSDRVDFAKEDWPFKLLRVNRKLAFYRRVPKLLGQILSELRDSDVFYVNSLFIVSAFASIFSAKRMLLKVVGDPAWERAVNRGWTKLSIEEYQVRFTGLKNFFLKLARNWAVKRASTVIVPGQYLVRMLKGWGVSEQKIQVILNGVSIPKLISSIDMPPTLSKFKVVVVARLVAWKGIKEVISALASHKEASLILVGDGPERDMLREFAAQKLEAGSYWFAGARSHAETLAIIKQSDLLILNSSYEGLPHVLIEATALEVPIIASKAGGIPEAVIDQQTGILIDVSDQMHLSTAIHKFLNGWILPNYAEGRQLILSKFSEERMLERTEQYLLACSNI